MLLFVGLLLFFVIGKECTFLPQSHGGICDGSAGRRGFFFQTWSYCIISGFRELYRDGILGHQFKKKLEYFALCYSQSLLLADFKENHTLLSF
jgi:hypothetical protein